MNYITYLSFCLYLFDKFVIIYVGSRQRRGTVEKRGGHR